MKILLIPIKLLGMLLAGFILLFMTLRAIPELNKPNNATKNFDKSKS